MTRSSSGEPEPSPTSGAAPGSRPPGTKRPRTRNPVADYPAWVQAVTAVLALLVAIVGVVFTGIQIFGDKAVATPIVIKAEAFIEAVTVGDTEVTGRGQFRNVDLAAEEILFIGKLESETPGVWLPVEADVQPEPTASAGGERVSGAWEAVRPYLEHGAYEWRVVVVPAGSGAGDGLADLKANGADASIVLAASAPFRTNE